MCLFFLNRRVRNRSHGGVGGAGGNISAYPITAKLDGFFISVLGSITLVILNFAYLRHIKRILSQVFLYINVVNNLKW